MQVSTFAKIGRGLVWYDAFIMLLMGMIVPIFFPEVYQWFLGATYPDYAPHVIAMNQSALADYGHRILGSLLIILGALQFEPNLRRNMPRLHRWSGRIYLVLGLIVSLTAVFLAIRHGFGGFPTQVWTIGTSVAYLWMLTLAWQQARNRNFKAHREWMIRSFALLLFVATMRALVQVMTPMLPTVSNEQMFVVTWVLAVVINMTIAEWWIHKTR